MPTRSTLRPTLGAVLLAAALAVPTTARATWSIVLLNPRTGEVAVASATCLTGFDLRLNTPVLITGVGGATAQSFVDVGAFNRSYIRDQLVLGTAPDAILAGLATLDSGHQTRQYGLADLRVGPTGVGRPLTFSGTGAGAWAGGQVGRATIPGGDEIVYAIQGNVLTGEVVVSRAVEAAIAQTPGDLPARLMAAMEAARVQGGDGRCSCGTNPVGCGAPPASFTKSAHIAYMLTARWGDLDASIPVYRATGRPRAITAADVTGDGKPDLIAATDNPRGLVAYVNISPSSPVAPMPDRWPVFDRPPVNVSTLPAQPAVLTSGDLDGDGRPDLVVTSSVGGSVALVRTTGPAQFDAPQTLTLADGPIEAVVADVTGDGRNDLVTANVGTGTVALFRNNGNFASGLAGGFDAPTILPARATAARLAVGDLDGDGDLDLAVTNGTDPAVSILINAGGGVFGTPTDLAVPGPAAGVAIGWFLSERVPGAPAEIAVGVGVPGRLAVLSPGATPGTYTTTTFPMPANPSALFAAPTPGTTRSTLAANLVSIRGAAVFTPAGSTLAVEPVSVPGATVGSVLRDLDGDGDPDLAFVQQALETLTVVPQSPAIGAPAPGQTRRLFPGGSASAAAAGGLAAGDYFMTFNVPNTVASDPDPVLTLRTRFDAFRADLVNKPDAITSSVRLGRPRLAPGDPTRALVPVRATLRDWNGSNVPANSPALAGLLALHAPLSAGRAALTGVSVEPDGTAVFSALGPAGPQPGPVDRLTLQTLPAGTLSPTNRPVILMPGVRLAPNFAVDWNGDGAATTQDIHDYLTSYFAQEPEADYDQDGTQAPRDVFAFLRTYFRP